MSLLAGNHEVHQSSAGMLTKPVSQSPIKGSDANDDGQVSHQSCINARSGCCKPIRPFADERVTLDLAMLDSQSKDSMVNDVSPSCNL